MNTGSDERKVCYEVAEGKASVYTTPVGIDSSFSFLIEDLSKTLCSNSRFDGNLYRSSIIIFLPCTFPTSGYANHGEI